MTFRRVSLQSADAADARLGSDVDQRRAMVAELSIAAWKASGRPLPSYTREKFPIRLIRPTRSANGA
jgi:DMSO/TMAO reductase YedYZ molybdopterin-dependent catalytic subunit